MSRRALFLAKAVLWVLFLAPLLRLVWKGLGGSLGGNDIRLIAEDISVEGTPTVTGFYGWGAWVNGGAWIHTAQGKVDFLYRSLEHVQRTIAEAEQGIARHDYHQQPAYGFHSVIYLAETKICIPLTMTPIRLLLS